MAHLFRTLAVLPVVHVVNSAWTCPSGWNDKDGVPKCAGAVDSTCSNMGCCDKVPTCSDYSVAWVLSGGCTAAGDTKFFDLKKPDVEVAGPQADADVKAACCTPFADAQCSDWPMACPSGKSIVGTNSAPPNSGNSLLQAKYTELCCVDTPKTCSDYSVLWAASQLIGLGCAADTKFFDLKKPDVEVAGPQGDADVKAACCTPFADAQCSDWPTACPSGKSIVGTNSAPPDNSDGKVLSQAKYNELCCVDPMKCADYTGEMNSVSQTAASLVVSVLAITAVMAHFL